MTPKEKVYDLKHYLYTGKIAVFSVECLSPKDLQALQSNHEVYASREFQGFMEAFEEAGIIIYVDEQPDREDWDKFSDEFFNLIEACASDNINWLRFVT